MKPEEFDRIANDELDGVATPAEREALHAHLAGHPEARERYRELSDLFATLKRVGLEESPPDLRASVMRAIDERSRPAGATARRSEGWVDFFKGLLRVPSWRSALTFGSGVGIGAAAIVLVAGNPVGGARYGADDLSGTMIPRGAVRSGERVEARTLEADGLTISADTRRTTDGVVLRIDASGDGANGAEVIATFDGGALHPVALRLDPPSAGDVEVGSDRVRIGLTGAGSFTLSFHTEGAGTAPLDLELHAGARTTRAALRTDSRESTKR
jgi:anti-sigma factor RsiW